MADLGGESVFQFRLLPDRVLGYMWPKWVRGGEKAEYRVHSVEQYQITLWRYGWEKEYVRMIGWVDEHGPQANRQTLPDGDFTQGLLGTGVNHRPTGDLRGLLGRDSPGCIGDLCESH